MVGWSANVDGHGMTESTDRADTERAYYEKGEHRKHWQILQSRFSHVYRCPNSMREVSLYEDLMRRAIQGGCVLEVGCGTGWNCRRLLEWGAREVHGCDISLQMLEAAQQYASDSLKFFQHDVHQPLAGQYDVIFGRAILHHVDYQKVLPMLYRESLAPGGEMLFMEPLGDNLLMRMYWKYGQKYHTPDERPFYRRDVEWLKNTFEHFTFMPYNYFSLPAGLLSSMAFRNPDNLLLRLCDHLDVYLANHWKFLGSRFRSAIFRIQKDPAGVC